ncbi:MAG: two-component system, OmpR family, sensor histidine kinase CssS [Halanaerobiales bacterium]|nr:two-component system, OmpR family, sensor histidine kinase CssS [Halanaerobiales bacterium]
MRRLKNKPLAVQIWIILGIVLGVSVALLTVLFPLVLRKSFTTETYARIEDSQEYFLNYGSADLLTEKADLKVKKKKPPHLPIRVVNHFFLADQGEILGRHLDPDILEEIKVDVQNQQQEIKHYSREINNQKIMYVVRRAELNGKSGYLVSFLLGRYRDNFVQTTLRSLISILVFVLLISWVASIFITRYLTRPLVQLQAKVKEIAVRKWDKPVSLNRGDEIGKLGETIEWMRCQLVEQDRKQQSFLQQVSHELKTPIMVIRSYAQSISDGIFPRGNLENSVKVIEEETERLEKRVRSLLNLTKFDYLSTHRLEKKEFDLAELVRKTINSFKWRSSDINWDINLVTAVIKGDEDKLKIALENLLDNQIRYAKETIRINLNKINKANESYILLKIWNDGPEIEKEIMENLFKKYKKGDDGDFGLGLAIVKLIVDMHQGMVWARNEDGGVAFYIKM